MGIGIPHRHASRYFHTSMLITVNILNLLGVLCNDGNRWKSEDTFFAIGIAVIHILYIASVFFNVCKIGSIDKKWRKAIHGVGGALLIACGAAKWAYAHDDYGSCARNNRIAGAALAILDGVLHVLPTEYINDQYL